MSDCYIVRGAIKNLRGISSPHICTHIYDIEKREQNRSRVRAHLLFVIGTHGRNKVEDREVKSSSSSLFVMFQISVSKFSQD